MSDLVEYHGKRYFQIGKAKNGVVLIQSLNGVERGIAEKSEVKKIPDGGPLSRREKNFAHALGELMKKYGVEFHETINEDGVHVSMEGREIAVIGYCHDGQGNFLLELAK